MTTPLRIRPVGPLSASLLGLILLFLVAGGAWQGAQADEGREPRKRWILKLQHGPLRTAVVRDASGASTAYHYMTIKVSNETAFARKWHPLVRAITDTKKTYLAGGWAEALGTIRKLEKNEGLVSIGGTAGQIKAGATIDTVAIFGPLDSLYDTIRLEIFGLVDPIAIYKIEKYGDETVIVDAAYWDRNQEILARVRAAAREAGSEGVPAPSKVEYVQVAESRFWEMTYQRLGDEFHAEDDLITFKKEGWKVVGDPTILRVISTEG